MHAALAHGAQIGNKEHRYIDYPNSIVARLTTMSGPLPSSSSVPRVSAAQRITNTAGQGHAAANLLPAVTHVKNIGRKLDETLKQTSKEAERDVHACARARLWV